MTIRQYLSIAFMGLFASLFLPKFEDPSLLLLGNGPIEIQPAAGTSAWQGFTFIGNGTLVGEIKRRKDRVAFKLVLDNSLYLVKAQCGGPASEMSIDPEFSDRERVVEATIWACQ